MVVHTSLSTLELSMPKFLLTLYSCLLYDTVLQPPSSCSFREESLHIYQGATQFEGNYAARRARQPCSTSWVRHNNQLLFWLHPSSGTTLQQIHIIPWIKIFRQEVRALVSFLAKYRSTFRGFQNLRVWNMIQQDLQYLKQSDNIWLPSTTGLSQQNSLQDFCRLFSVPDRYQLPTQSTRLHEANHQVCDAYQVPSLSDQ
jgi:hypothetical protein